MREVFIIDNIFCGNMCLSFKIPITLLILLAILFVRLC